MIINISFCFIHTEKNSFKIDDNNFGKNDN